VLKNRPNKSTIDYLTERFSSIPLAVIEGHIIFNHKTFYDLCNLRYFFTLDKDECLRRRQLRVYDPPNPPGYFEKCGWPLYVERLNEVQKLSGIQYFDAKHIPLLQIYTQIFSNLTLAMGKIISCSTSTDLPKGKLEILKSRKSDDDIESIVDKDMLGASRHCSKPIESSS